MPANDDEQSAIETVYNHIVERGNYGATTPEIIDALKINPNTVRGAIRKLEETHKIIEYGERRSDSGSGKPANIYIAAEINQKVVKEHQTETETEEKADTLLESIVNYSMKKLPPPEDEVWVTLYASFLKENPIDLMVKLAVWLCSKYNEVYHKLKNNISDRNIVNKCKEDLAKLKEFTNGYFCSILGVPTRKYDYLEQKHSDGPIKMEAIKIDRPSEPEPARVTDENELRRYLRMSVFGGKVLEVISIENFDFKRNPVAGTDSSVYEIYLRDVAMANLPNSSLSIVTSVGVKQDSIGGTPIYDRQPEPRVLAQYEEKRAIEEGLLIPPPGRFGFDEGMEKRVQEAAMDLRQYIKDRDMLFSGEYPAKLLFRDGRIFPLEHAYQDAVNYGLHGRLVRSAMRNFLNLTALVNADKNSTLFCGYVKRTHLSTFAPLAVWFLAFHKQLDTGEPLSPGWELDDYLNVTFIDSDILSNIFYASRDRKEKTVITTFRVLRRFQSTQNTKNLKYYEPSNDVSVWEERIKEIVPEDDVAVDEAEIVNLFGSLMARSAVLMFYSSLTNDMRPSHQKRIQIPRIEVMAPYDDLDYHSLPEKEMIFSETEKKYVKRIVSALFGKKGLMTQYPHGDLTGFANRDPEIFLAPEPLVLAHNYSKELGKLYSMDFKNLLYKTYRRMFGKMGGI